MLHGLFYQSIDFLCEAIPYLAFAPLQSVPAQKLPLVDFLLRPDTKLAVPNHFAQTNLVALPRHLFLKYRTKSAILLLRNENLSSNDNHLKLQDYQSSAAEDDSLP